ncbi:MAG: ABC transporter ATP-binding protein [Candidatus Eisenbacteria bacterium]|nr:ABC transporter ATP-binding protein [Candidatus Eisenbacteria bacterium]
MSGGETRGSSRPDATDDDDETGVQAELLQAPKLDRRVLARLLGFVRPYRAWVAWSVVLLLLLSAGELAFPILTKRAIDDCIRPGDLRGLYLITTVYLGLLIAVFGLRYGQAVLTQRMGQQVMHDLRRRIFGHLQRLHLGYHERNPVGRTMTRLTGDVEVLNELFTSGLVSIFGDLLTLIGIAAVLLALNWKLALVTLAVVPLLFTASWIFRAKVRVAYGLTRLKVSAINSFLQENIVGITLVQLFNREARHRAQFEGLNAGHRDAFLKSVFYYSVFFPVVDFLEYLAVALILWYGGGQTIQNALSLGALVAFIQYSERFFRPIRDLSERYNVLQSAMVSAERIFELLDTEPTITSPAVAAVPAGTAPQLGSGAALAAPGTLLGQVEFRDVHFSYVQGEEILKGIRFTVRPGESVALVGHTGAGKTTITNLLTRFYDIDSGAILVDGLDVREWDLAALRRRIGVVLQDVFLWSGGVRLNVGLRSGLPTERIEAALRAVGADAVVERLGGDLDAEVGERGNRLSVGQRQLIAFARALAQDPPILLLDEATSSVDTETEIRIREALKVLLTGRTSLVIAHRLSTIRYVDRILVLHRGRLVEEGTHDELLAHGGIYSKYYQLEYQRQSEDAPAL